VDLVGLVLFCWQVGFGMGGLMDLKERVLIELVGL
jgi:hypothetical protein